MKENSIKEDIERCNQLIKVEHANWIGISNQLAIKHLLEKLEKKDTLINTMRAEFERLEDLEDNTDILKSELDRLQKENEELKIDNNKQWKERCRLSFELDDSIPKSVIQDKIEEIINNSTFGCVGCEWNDIEVVQLLENILRGNK